MQPLPPLTVAADLCNHLSSPVLRSSLEVSFFRVIQKAGKHQRSTIGAPLPCKAHAAS